MSVILPSMGRNGIVNLVRKLSGAVVTGWRDIDPSSEFVAGQIAKLTESNGRTLVTVCIEATADKPIGILFSHKTLSFYKPVVEESQTFDLIAIKDVKEFLGSVELDAGKYTQIRLNVDEATAIINGTEYNLTIPSKTIKLVKNFNLEANETTTLTLDFDAQKSIHSAGDKYTMKPTIKVIEE